MPISSRPLPDSIRDRSAAHANERGPAASPVFVGRADELGRAERGLRDLGLVAIIGLVGVGKTALAQRIADSWRGPRHRHHVRAGQPIAELLDDLRRACADDREQTPELRSDGERLADAAGRLERAAAMVLLEDIDRLGDGAPDLLAALTASLRRARVIATSRTRLFGAAGPERVEIVLGGLDAASSSWRPGSAARSTCRWSGSATTSRSSSPASAPSSTSAASWPGSNG